MRNTVFAATSRASITRFCGLDSAIFARYSLASAPNILARDPMLDRTSSVSTCQGHTALTVMPSRAVSNAMDFVNPNSAAFEDAYALLNAAPTFHDTEEILMTRPLLARIIFLSTAKGCCDPR